MADIPAIAGSDTGTWKSLVNAIISLINGKFNSRPYQWANAAARTAQTGMTVGEFGYQADTQVLYRANAATTAEPWESPWITWSTAPTNLTVGTGGSATSVQRYRYIGGRTLWQVHYILGTSGQSVTGQPTINLPLSLQLPVARTAELVSAGSIYDVSATTTFQARARINITTANQIAVSSYTGTYAGITNLAPMTWAAGDELAVEWWADPA